MKADRLDHLVLTVKDIETTCRFYAKVLGLDILTFEDSRQALTCGSQRIHLHQVGQELEPKAQNPTPGSADLCFLADISITKVIAHLEQCGVKIVLGPVERMGAAGQLESVYFRDTDLNLIEVAVLRTGKD